MVKGIDKLAAALKEYPDNYVIIGGTACDILLAATNMHPRATKDIDMVLVVEKMTEDFKSALTGFFKAGGYKCNKRKGRANDISDYEMYRFVTDDLEYPVQIELLSKHSDLFGNEGEFNIEPVVGENDEVTSLSAIVLDGDYYNLLVSTREMQQGLSIASTAALICLKAYAHTNLLKDKNAGSHLNGAFVVELADYIANSGIDYWIYGHSHRNISTVIGHTQCISNQLGYVFCNEHTSFSRNAVINV